MASFFDIIVELGMVGEKPLMTVPRGQHRELREWRIAFSSCGQAYFPTFYFKMRNDVIEINLLKKKDFLICGVQFI